MAPDALAELAKQLDDGKGLAQTVADVKDANQRGALHFAAREAQTETCKFLLEECDTDVNVKMKMERLLLFTLLGKDTLPLPSIFWNCGADPSIPSELGDAAVHHSAGIGDIKLLKFFLANGVDVDFKSDAGTPLIWAAGHAQHDAVKMLLEHKANKTHTCIP